MDEENFEKRIRDGLNLLGDLTSRSMFGGLSFYWNGVIFAILFRDRLYLKVDDQSQSDFVSRGMKPFQPNERQTLKSYFEVPPDVLDNPEALLFWAREAIRAAQMTQSPAR